MIKLATVFSGIGAIEQAFIKSNIPYEIVFACDNGERTISQTKEEIFNYAKLNKFSSCDLQNYVKKIYSNEKKPNFVKQSYFANYAIAEKNWHEDIRFINGRQYRDKVDIFVGGSPCQSFSNMGKRGGLNDTRGTLFYEFARLVKEIKPKVFIYENVPGMLNHDKGNTWMVIQNVFANLGYKISFRILNSVNFGIPQNRKRIYVIGFIDKKIKFTFPEPVALTTSMFDYLDKVVQPCFYLGKKGFEFVTKNKSRAKINQNIIRTQKANQQYNWNGDFYFEEINKIVCFNDIKARAYVGEYDNKIGVVRQLTPRECLRLMGFDDSFKIVVPNVHMYRQSGNSIVVNVLQAILNEIIKCGALDENN